MEPPLEPLTILKKEKVLQIKDSQDLFAEREEVKPMIKYNSTKCHFAENKAFRLFHRCFTIPHNAIWGR